MRKSIKKSRKILKKNPRARKIRPGGARASDVCVVLDARRDGVDEIYSAAYLMIDRAYVLLEGDPKKSMRVTLRPKDVRTKASLTAVRSDFMSELAAQRVRWSITRNNQSIREYIAENALSLAAEFGARSEVAEPSAAAEQLTPDQRAEIEKLIAEVETEIKAMNEQKPATDPKAAVAPWEAGRLPGGENPA